MLMAGLAEMEFETIENNAMKTPNNAMKTPSFFIVADRGHLLAYSVDRSPRTTR